MNAIFTHPNQPQMQVEVILASRRKGGNAPPLYTIRWRCPRIIHGEIMTHRVFSRNARSSRAVPVMTMINEVRNAPFIPWHWTKNKRGMQGTDPLTPDEEARAVAVWLEARDAAVSAAMTMTDPNDLNIHKQIPNRMLEPYSWIDVLITANQWANFTWLRDHKAAEHHLQDLARLVASAIDAATVQELDAGEWHLPYIAADDLKCGDDGLMRHLSAARCARISYAPFDGDASINREIERYEMLVSDDRIHASPMEHQATPDTLSCGKWDHPELHGNLIGWIQARKLIPNHDMGEFAV